MKKASKNEKQNLKALLVFAASFTVANMILLVSLHPDEIKTSLLGIALSVLLTTSICIDKRKTHVTRGYVLTVSGILLITTAIPFIMRDLWFIGVLALETLIYISICFCVLRNNKGN